MPRANLRKTAASQARSEYQPQIRGVKRETHSQVRSIESSGPALEASLQTSARQLRHAGLAPKDLAIALREIANRTADVGASTALQAQQARQEGHGQIVDLLAAEGQAQRAALTALQTKAAEHAQDIHDEIAGEQRGLHMDILKEQAEKKLGLGSYYKHGLTPSEERSAHSDHSNASFYAKQYFQAARSGAIDGVDPDPKKWTPETWNHLIEQVKKDASVDIPTAERAVSAIRDHVQGPGALDILGTIARAAAPVAAAAAPPAVAPIAQFGTAALLHHKR